MKRQSPSIHALRVGIWLLAGIIAVCALWTSKLAHAQELAGSEIAGEVNDAEPEMTAESGSEEYYDEEQEAGHESTHESTHETGHETGHEASHETGARCHCQSETSTQCCKKGKCAGVCLDPGHPAKPKHKKPGDIDEGDCPSIRYRMDDCIRSGEPNCIYKWAKPSITDKYSAWYVGGGAWFKGRGRTAEEGTWGLDYDGAFGHARTWLNYTCGKRQGGEGAYETDHVPLKKKF